MSTLGQRNGQPLFNVGPTLACRLGSNPKMDMELKQCSDKRLFLGDFA